MVGKLVRPVHASHEDTAQSSQVHLEWLFVWLECHQFLYYLNA